MDTKFKKFSLIILICYLPYAAISTYEYFSFGGSGLLTYSQELLYLFCGPILLLIYSPGTIYFTLAERNINYIAIVPFIIMLVALILGLWKLDKSIWYQVLFAIGALIWFLFGFVTVGIHYLTV